MLSGHSDQFDANDLISIFASCFFLSHNTRLVRGGDEPIYLPATGDDDFHKIVFAHGYFSSALHEIAHWLVAGEARRQQEDYGYWYAPDGRTAQQQAIFESVEVAPQAIEWLLSKAFGKPFRFSLDNLTGEVTDPKNFAHAVLVYIAQLTKNGLNERTQLFYEALCDFYNTDKKLDSKDFKLSEIYRD
jgi:elongation factor P hydroxylase